MSVTAPDASADTWTKLDTWATPRAATRNDTWTRTVQLLNNPAASAAARAHVKRVIKAWNAGIGGHPALGAASAEDSLIDEDTLDTAVLLTSELVTNAIIHGESPVTVAVSWSGGTLRVEVHDKSRFMPAPWPVIDSADAETGRGLLLVDTLAADWGFYRTPGGKAVYFTLDRAPER
jgi:anti-sigma regulatory factor (Ser/Thr protein kinase)